MRRYTNLRLPLPLDASTSDSTETVLLIFPSSRLNLLVEFSDFSMTTVIYHRDHDFPAVENPRLKFHDFTGFV